MQFIKPLPIVLILILVFLQYRLWFGPEGMRDIFQLKKQLAQQKQETEALKKRNQNLVSQVQYMQAHREAIESRARQELGMIKRNETFYQIVTARP
jgi:cell division protein FtsB